jgi:2-phospho-L-lactate/phosphoenolpyruvate guanylyltransferase
MNDMPGVWAIVPVKRFAKAKSRLAAVLGCRERHELARNMFEDVLEALLRCQDVLAGTIVVTADSEAAAIGSLRGATVVFEEDDHGINAAVRLAVDRLGPSTEAGAVVVPSDLPQLSSRTIAAAVEAISSPSTLAIAAAYRDGGTNLLACRPAAAIPLHFGRSSFLQHTLAARHAGLAVRPLHMPELRLDIDRPDDLGAFQALRTNTRTHRFLAGALVESHVRHDRVGSHVDASPEFPS